MTETSQDRPVVPRPTAGEALTVGRIHTTPGVHPYDEVTWERRDVVQSNWRTGEIIFEQKRVEFPDFWSVNASTIVTTKYFRGALGTEQREWSLKQLIDRVVGTYVAAGVEHGYFATDEDAEVFEHELTWALLHQTFSFNSPVWFNVGTASKQQVSACQPYEALVSTPSGLVPIGRLVEEGAVGTKVYDAHGLTSVVAAKANGVKPVLRIHMENGQLLDVTSDHLVWRSPGGFVQAGDLRPGDALAWHRTYSYGEREISPVEVAEAALAGWLQADGFVEQHTGINRSLTIEAKTVTAAGLDWVTEAIDDALCGAHSHERSVETIDTSSDHRRTRLHGEQLRLFVERLGLLAGGVDMQVPPHLFAAPLPVVAAYLRSLFQAHGHVTIGHNSARIRLNMISGDLGRGIQSLLLRFGVLSRVQREVDGHGRRGCWSLCIQSLADRRAFADEIGFIEPRKSEELAASLEIFGVATRGGVNRLQIERIEDLGAMEVYDIQTESGEYLSSNLRVHNCFILSVEDDMDSILNWYKEEGLIFKGGSGSGVNLSRIRSSKELLSSGGTASGPVSFMRGADASAGTIKSGGATRRAAKMVILDVDHPDVEEFIETKAREEEKIRALRDAGFDMDLGGKDIASVQYQNANNSVRVSDAFMRAVEQGADFGLRARLTGAVIDTVSARQLFRKLAAAAWACADPGLQYDDTINDWHTCPETGRITASNPCFPGDQRVVTDKGLVRIGDLVRRAADGETFSIYTNDVTAETDPAPRIVASTPNRYMVTGLNEVIELRFSDGSRLRCTPKHRIWTANRGWVHAEALTEDDRVVRSFHHAPRPLASRDLPAAAQAAARHVAESAQRVSPLTLPEKWDADFAHFLGWLVGDGCLTDQGVVSMIYGSAVDQTEAMPRHQRLFAAWTGFEAKSSTQRNGVTQVRWGRRTFAEFLAALGVSASRAPSTHVPDSIFEAPEDAVAAFLRGLFDADGCVVNQAANATRYIGLGSRSEELLLGVQELLASLGVASRVHRITKKSGGGFRYVRKDGSEVMYTSDGPSLELRISRRSIREFANRVGFSLSTKAAKLAELVRQAEVYDVDESVRLVSRDHRGFETTYNLTEPRNHSYVVAGTVVANCSEYLHLDNSSCNLASINLLTFLRDDDTFDAKRFAKVVELVVTAMDISICFADFPTEAITEITRDYRQLGLGYSNLGALLMATGHGYDSEGGRALAASITSLMTATAYKRSAELAGIVGPYAGYARNAEAHKRIMRKHAAANDAVRTLNTMDREIHAEATRAWQECLARGNGQGWRNAQASLLAPTGCLTGETLISTGHGLLRLSELGDVWGDRWQDIDVEVSTDEGPRHATELFVNGEEPTRRIVTEGGYRLQGTLGHRVKVIDPATGEWVWKRLADVASGDVLPLQLGTMVGEPRRVPLPILGRAYYAGDRTIYVPEALDAELAELVGYFMGDGSLHAKGIRLCVAEADTDVVDRLRVLSKGLFGLEPVCTPQRGYTEVTLQSVRLARWWQAAGFAKDLPGVDHAGKGWTPRVPTAIRETNDPAVYAAFLRGLFEADGHVLEGVPSVSTASETFADDLRVLLLALGLPTTTRRTTSGWGGGQFQVRLRNVNYRPAFAIRIGFLGGRKAGLVAGAPLSHRPGGRDRIHLPRSVWDELVPIGSAHRAWIQQAVRRGRGVSRGLAQKVFEETGDPRLEHAFGYLFEVVVANDDGGVQPTYDLSVPDNVTYVANGFVSHNTISFMLDCDTTGVEPDFSLVKFKKLVGGGSLQIVNQTIPLALRKLGYAEETIEAIVEYIAEHGHVVDAPGLRPEHYEVFDCAMGQRSIAPMGHVRMMAAVQPFLSGAISKCVVGETLLTTADGLIRIGSLYDGEEPDTFRDEIIEVASVRGPRKTDAFYYGGRRPVREAVLRSGHRIVGTPNHRVLVATPSGLGWRQLSDVREGDYVAVQYGADMWSTVPAQFDDFRGSVSDPSQQAVRVPEAMTEEMAFLLGAYAAQGHAVASTGTVVITNSVDAVLERVKAAWQNVFGAEARIEHRPGKRPQVIALSTTVVEFLRHLGCGFRASDKRIPDVVLQSPRPMVLAFLEGLALDGYTSAVTRPKWAICLESPALLDDLQAVLTNLGIVHGRIVRRNTDGKIYGEVYASGKWAADAAALIPFPEPEKAARAGDLIRPVPAGRGSDRLRFSPVATVSDAGEREVYDVSVPTTRAFVGNGMVNHNTVNMPESATVEDIENVYFQGWKLGLKALAIYRDNCKVGQPLSDGKAKQSGGTADVERLVEYRPVRKRLPKSRPSITTSFAVGGAEGYMSASSYPDDGLGEIFLKMSKQGSTLAGMMDAFSIAVSIGLQYGVPLETYVSKFTNMRFEPAGLTDDPDVRMAQSIMDYIFRRLALDYLPFETRSAYGIYTAEERTRQLETGSYEPIESGEDVEGELETYAQSAPTSASTSTPKKTEQPALGADAKLPPANVGSSAELLEAMQGRTADAPMCFTCGTKMRPAGSCYVCEGCGSTSGCS